MLAAFQVRLSGRASATPAPKRQPMLYAILAYHVEEDVTSWTPQEDAALMVDLNKVHDRLNQEGRMGPAARLAGPKGAGGLAGLAKGVGTAGPFTQGRGARRW